MKQSQFREDSILTRTSVNAFEISGEFLFLFFFCRSLLILFVCFSRCMRFSRLSFFFLIRNSRKQTYSENDNTSEEETEDENVLSNTMLLTGPIGCGTTAAVYACAKHMDFKVNYTFWLTSRNGPKIFL